MELSSGGVIGGTIPGIPAVMVGRSERLGWAITSSYLDDQDLHLEELNPENGQQYRTPDGWADFRTRRSIIDIKDSQPVTITQRWTENGPVLPGSVYDPGVCLRTTVNAIVKAEIPPERVIFEIVESERVKDMGHLRGIVNFYRSAGFKIALDDYGSGYNNLDTLMQLEPDYLKLDKSLVQRMAEG